jgi:hypothetical protein
MADVTVNVGKDMVSVGVKTAVAGKAAVKTRAGVGEAMRAESRVAKGTAVATSPPPPHATSHKVSKLRNTLTKRICLLKRVNGER